MIRKVVVIVTIIVLLGFGIYFVFGTKNDESTSIKETLTVEVNDEDLNKKICSGGFSKWIDGEFVVVRESKCITEAEYKEYLKSPDYLCKYYQKSIWKESEREYGKKQYRYTLDDLKKIKNLKEEGMSLCNDGKYKEGEAKLIEAITIISFTMMN